MVDPNTQKKENEYELADAPQPCPEDITKTNATDTIDINDELTEQETPDAHTDTDAKGDAAENEAKAAPTSPLAFVLEYLELFVVCLCAVMLLFFFGFRICNVDGNSMLPTLENGQSLLVSNLFYEPETGDVIIFHQTSEDADYNKLIVKRVIATEGQHVRIDFTAGTVEVDGKLLDEDYIQLVDTLGQEIGEYQEYANHHIYMTPSPDGTTHRIFEATVPEGTLFVMGDNRNNSSDSRTKVIGFVDERRVLGHVICRLTPLEAFGSVD